VSYGPGNMVHTRGLKDPGRNGQILIKLRELRCEAAEWSQMTQDTFT